MQDASGFGIFGQVANTIGFNVPIGFSRPSGGGGVVVINYLVTESNDNITTESNDPLILEQAVVVVNNLVTQSNDNITTQSNDPIILEQ